MSSNAGGLWSAQQDTASQARMNQKTNTIDTGSNLAAINPTFPGMEVFALDSTGGFTANFKYVRDATNSTWLQMLPTGSHDHSSSTTGGVFSTILSDNVGQFLLHDFISPTKSMFLQTITGGTITDVQGSGNWFVQLSTGTVTNNLAQIDRGGIALDFGNKIKWAAKIGQSGGTTGLNGRMGINVEQVGAAISNTTKSLGYEFCDTCGTGYQLLSCDGGTRSVVTTNQAFSGNNSVRFLYTPSTSLVGTINQTVATTKTSNLPNSGACAQDRISRFGIQTTNTISKTLQLFGGMVSGVPNDTYFL
jgi:hypothetical protein